MCVCLPFVCACVCVCVFMCVRMPFVCVCVCVRCVCVCVRTFLSTHVLCRMDDIQLCKEITRLKKELQKLVSIPGRRTPADHSCKVSISFFHPNFSILNVSIKRCRRFVDSHREQKSRREQYFETELPNKSLSPAHSLLKFLHHSPSSPAMNDRQEGFVSFYHFKTHFNQLVRLDLTECAHGPICFVGMMYFRDKDRAFFPRAFPTGYGLQRYDFRIHHIQNAYRHFENGIL